MTAVALRDVTYTYPGAPAPALRDVCLDIAVGELVVVAGGSVVVVSGVSLPVPVSGPVVGVGVPDEGCVGG